jgi:DNA polymerase
MTAHEKAGLASFLEMARGYLLTGYRAARHPAEAADFADDPASKDAMPAEDAAAGNTLDRIAGNTLDHIAGNTLDRIAFEIASCRMCGLSKQRKRPVPGEGSPRPLVMVIGEAPGADEDAQGRPFVGPAGKLLDKMLAAIGLSRETNCFIANILKCRPPGNRDPEPDERAVCTRFLERQILLLKPRAILCAGRVSAQTLLQTTAPMASLRNGKRWNYVLSGGGVETTIPLFATYHPSALLRNEGWKRPAWEDLKAFREFLDLKTE